MIRYGSMVDADEVRQPEDERQEPAAAAEDRLGLGGEERRKLIGRLRRIEGQVRGLQKMVEEDRWCADIMTQISSVQEALRGVSRELMRNHLRHCVTDAMRSRDPARAEATYAELIDLFGKFGR